MQRLTTFFVLITLSFFILINTGCEETDLGRYCVVGFDDETAGAGVKVINAEAPECLDRICVLQTCPKDSNGNCIVGGSTSDSTDLKTAQYCSTKCSDDSGCTDADSGANCDKGFICIRLGDESEGLADKCICECRDYLSTVDECNFRCSTGNRENDEECSDK